ncbi:hypothetical protein QBC38DRAFT_124234 [Podospora fimiseda]|uniref:Uncharacterized protein n=1 Tax=Podospora fimiseda TaxID=252190 RepID=A0AAN7BT86_9PEZI|nr:hypothetical protein QBC38DRAFT_124234 [Podospora fimiseda]
MLRVRHDGLAVSGAELVVHDPSLIFLNNLPLHEGKFWGIYVVILSKEGADDAVYVGSGTEATVGVKTRFRIYQEKTNNKLPRHVRRLYDSGFCGQEHIDSTQDFPPLVKDQKTGTGRIASDAKSRAQHECMGAS